MKKRILKAILGACVFVIFITTNKAQTSRNFDNATGFVFGDIKFNMPYTSARSFLINAPEDYPEKERVFLSYGKFGTKLWDMPIHDTIEMGFYNKKLNKIIFIIDPKNLNTDRITKEFTKNPDTLTDDWAYWIKGNYVLDITIDPVTKKKRIQLEYMGW